MVMNVKQLSVEMHEEPDLMANVASMLAGNGINIFSLAKSEAGGRRKAGKLRLIVNDTDNAYQVLTENGLSVEMGDVVVVETPDKPGGMAQVLKIVKELGLSISYIYAFSHRSGENALVVIGFEDIDYAAAKMIKGGLRVLSMEELLAM